MTALSAFFATRSHHPSADHWAALEDIARTLEAMADGTCPAKIHLSAIDPGVGKSQTVIHFARALVASEAHRGVGMVVCVGRITEARAIAADLGIPVDRLAVLTSDDDANAMGGAAPGEAQVLVTTQQRVERACEGRGFGEVAAFHYQGRARAVRAWDEAWLPGQVVTLDRLSLLGLLRPLARVSPRLADDVEDFAGSLRTIEDGALVHVPDFAAAAGVSLEEVMAAAAGLTGRFRDDLQMTATALVTMNGRAARVRRDGYKQATALDYRDTLPDDLAPLLVLDASGRVRRTYAAVEEHRGSLVRLRAAVKDYTPLTIRVWRTGGGKSAWGANRDWLIQGIGDAIRTKPGERWLVVVHKPDAKVGDVLRDLHRTLPAEVVANVSALTWGQHMATNAYADTPNVILAGTLFMAPSFYAALTHLAADRSVLPGLAPPEEIAATMRGEHANLVLQSLCRGRVRKSDGARCLRMDAWIIASSRSGIPQDLDRIFPGCTVRPWDLDPVPTLTGSARRALEVVRDADAAGETWLAFRTIADRLQSDPRNFRKRVTALPAWIAAVEGLGFRVEAGPGRRSQGIRKASLGAVSNGAKGSPHQSLSYVA